MTAPLHSDARRAISALAVTWEILGETSGGATVRIDGVQATATGGSAPNTNMAQVNDPVPDARATIDRLVGFFESHAVPFEIQILDGLDDVAEAVLSAGLTLHATEPFMIAAADAVRAPQQPSGVRIDRVLDDRSIEDNVRVCAAGFGTFPDQIRVFMNERIARHPAVAAFNASLDGEVVATATMVAASGAAGIFGVATTEPARRRGVGTAVTAAAVAAGLEQGCDLAYLQASSMGFSVYRRLGFRSVARHHSYRRP